MKNITGKDLNLLTVFAALWRERNVTRAAKALGMTQPALSRALARLRVEFADPLFVRAARGVVPTDRALRIASSVEELIRAVNLVYMPDSVFDPQRFQGVITIATSDYFEAIAATKLIPRLNQEAPGLTVNFRPTLGAIPRHSMEKGDIDLMIAGIYERVPEGFYHQRIFRDHYRSAVRVSHPMRRRMDVDRFADLSHVLVTPQGDLTGIVDKSLGKLGKRRRVVVGFSSFLSAGWTVAQTDFVLTAPGLLIDNLKMFLPLEDFPTPIPIPQLDVFQVWHERTHHDPARKWLRGKIADYCRK